MVNIEELVGKFKEKIVLTEKEESYKKNIIEPFATNSFNSKFAEVFQDLSRVLNEKVGSVVIKYKNEGKNRFAIEGMYHRIIFQRGKLEVLDNLINVNVIPIYMWKGVTKHLGPISFAVKTDSDQVKWDLPVENLEEYAKNLFAKLIEDEDFSI